MIRMSSISSLAFLVALGPACADVSPETIQPLGASDRVETSIGALDFKDGVPSVETARRCATRSPSPAR